MPRKNPDQDAPVTIEQARSKLAQVMDKLQSASEPEPISSGRKPTEKIVQTYGLKLTQLQRESLIQHTRIKNKIKQLLKAVGEGMQCIGVTQKQLDHLDEEINIAASFAPGPHKKRLLAVLDKVDELIACDQDSFFDEAPSRRKTAPKSDLIYQFKITLLELEPAIWRRIQVPDCDLTDLHIQIQAAFGWANYHLHEFKINGVQYCEPNPYGGDFELEFENESGVMISDLLFNAHRRTRWIYTYDFGDDWKHEILFEGASSADPKTKYPVCTEGQRACPPEDCGGPWGYANYLDAISDPKHPEHEYMLQWRGRFKSEAFDAKKTTKEMRRVSR